MNTDEQKENSHYDNIVGAVSTCGLELNKFKSTKQKEACKRARAQLLNIKKMCDALRKELKCEFDSIPVRHRKAKEDNSE